MKVLFLSVLATVFLKFGCTHRTPVVSKSQSGQIAFYNVENLFDTINIEGKNDGEYTPESKKLWNTEKYTEKLANLNRVLGSIDSNGALIAVGLCEVENEAVVNDLITTGFLNSRGFDLVHKESPDFRGIDVAFVYDTNKFKVTNAQWLTVNLPDSTRTTREILCVFGEFAKQNVAIYVNHWPSRWGGTEKSKPGRIAAAKTLRTHLDSLKAASKKVPEIIIMGDFNDYPDNESILEVLKADSVPNSSDLYNATWALHRNKNVGSHNYKGHWGMLDQMILSNNLESVVDTVYVHKRDFMCYTNKKGDKLPSRTYSRNKYYGGFSDHLPVVIKLK